MELFGLTYLNDKLPNNGYNFKKIIKVENMAQVPADIGCTNERCIAKDDCNRQVIAKDGTAREIQEFGGSEVKKCGKFIQK